MLNGRISRSYGRVVRTSLMAQQLRNLPAMQETQETVKFLVQEASLEEEMATHSKCHFPLPLCHSADLHYICIRKEFPFLLT